MIKKILNFKKNKEGTALFMTIIILSGILVVSLGSAEIIFSGMKMSRTQEYSTKAYFAAESGAERILWEDRKNSFESCSVGDYVDFSNLSCFSTESENLLSNDAYYLVIQENNYFKSIGGYEENKRSISVADN